MPPVLAVPASHLALIVGGILQAELLARTGAGLLPWWRGVPLPRLTRWGLSVLVGVAAWGLIVLGLALTGLFYVAVLAAAAFAAALVIPASRGRSLHGLEAAREWLRIGPLPAVALAAGFALAAMQALVREGQFDSLVYHLGVSSQFFTVHRAVLSDIHLAFQFSLPVEMTYALPVGLGDDRLARVLTMTSFVAAAAVFAGLQLARGRATAAWTGPLLVLAAPTIAAMAPMAKNDITASAWFMAGALLTARGCWGLGGVLLGCAVAGKIVYGLPVALWLLCALPPPSRWLRLLPGLVLPGLGWWIKTWLATGTPVFPTTTSIWPSPFWSIPNGLLWDFVLRRDWPANTLHALRLPEAFVHQMRSDYLLALLLLPGLVVVGPRGRRLTGVLLGCFAILATAHNARYMLPLAWWLVFAEAEMLDRIPGRAGRLATTALAGFALLTLAADPLHQRPGWRELLKTPAGQWAEFTTQRETVEHLRTAGIRRMIVVGDLRSYPWPARILYDGAIGETPLTWAFAHASRSPAEIRKKFRQTGASVLLYNYVSNGFVLSRYHAFPWSEPALRRYVMFCRQYLVPGWRSATTDNANGGFYVFDLLPRPQVPAPATTWFAPGTESVYWPGVDQHLKRRFPESIEGFKAALRRLPDVGLSWNYVGHEYCVMNDYVHAFPWLEPYAAQGMRDDINLTEYALALIATGRIGAAEAALVEAADRYPDLRARMQLQLAGLLGDRSQEAVQNGRVPDAAAFLTRAEAVFATIPPNADPDNEMMRVQLTGYLIGMRGEVWLAYGDQVKARDCFERALRIDTSGPMTPRWKAWLASRGSPMQGR